MKLWRWLQDAIAPTGPPVFLVGIIGFLISVLMTIYPLVDRMRQMGFKDEAGR
jgi:hypothetical protein